MTSERYETEHKYRLPPTRAERFLAATDRELSPLIYDTRRPTSYTRTTYLDTPSLAYRHSNQQSMQRRLRIREYASSLGPDDPPILTGACYLELKLSEAGRRVKTRLRATPVEIAAFIARSGHLRGINGDPSACAVLRGELRDRAVAPRVSVWYRRRSFRRDDQRVRVTVDADIKFADPSSPHDALGRGPECVLEIKHFGVAPDWLRDAMASLGVPESLSKYELGMRAIEMARTIPYRSNRPARSESA